MEIFGFKIEDDFQDRTKKVVVFVRRRRRKKKEGLCNKTSEVV